MQKIFLSSTWKDLEQTRKRVVKALTDVYGHDVELVHMERFGASSERPFDFCIQQVLESDVLILLIKWRYGWQPTPTEKGIRLASLHRAPDPSWSMTRWEYETANAHNKVVHAYLWNGDKIDVDQVDDYSKYKSLLEAFKSDVDVRHVRATFKTDQDLIYLVLGDLYQKVLKPKMPVGAEAVRLCPNTPPAPRPLEPRGMDWYDEEDAAYFHGRAADVQRLADLTLEHPIVRLTGPSGVGKSSLLRAGLVPLLRQRGWRAVVIRPFDDPSHHLPEQARAALIDPDGPALSPPLSLALMRRQLASLLKTEGCPGLVLLIDQVEEMLAPGANPQAAADLTDFLRDLYQSHDTDVPIKAVVSYRLDADARLGPLWQRVSERADGLPYHTLAGLSSETAGQVIAETAKTLGWSLHIPPSELAAGLRVESQSMEAAGDVYPPYLQMLLAALASLPNKQARAEDIDQMGGIGGVIGRYLMDNLGKLPQLGQDAGSGRRVLEVLTRSSGQKGMAATRSSVALELGLARDDLAPLIDALVRLRLVRPLPGDQIEIAHDRLALLVQAELSPEALRGKRLRELVAAKAAAYADTRAPLRREEMLELYTGRQHLHLSSTEEQLILHSNLVGEGPAWYWYQTKTGALMLTVIQQFLDHADWRVRRTATEVLGHLGMEALPELRKLAEDKSGKVRQAAAEALGHMGIEALPELRKLAADKAGSVRQTTVETLCKMGTEALPELRKWDRDVEWYARQAAAVALGHMGTEALPGLCTLAGDAVDSVRRAVAEALGHMGPEALPDLRRLMKDKGSSVREAVVESLATLGVQALPDLRTLAGDKEWFVRQAAAQALGRMGPEALPDLHKLAGDEDGYVRESAAEALGHMGTEALPGLHKLAGDYESDVRRAAAEALGQMGPEALPDLRKLAGDKEGSVRQRAAQALGQMGPEALPDLRKLAGDKDESVRLVVVGALGRIGTEALPDLHKLAGDEDEYVRQSAANALGHIGIEALFELRGLAGDYQSDVRRAAAESLGRMGMEALPDLCKLAGDKDGDVRTAAAEALGHLSTDDLPGLRTLAADEEGYVRQVAAEALGQMGPRALPDLRTLAGDKDGGVRSAAAQALGRMGRETLPDLHKLTGDKVDSVRRAAAEALGHIGTEALPDLRKLAGDKEGSVRQRAAEAFGRVGTEALPDLRRLVNDKGMSVREAVVESLATLGVEALDPLTELAAADSSHVLRQHALTTLMALDRRLYCPFTWPDDQGSSADLGASLSGHELAEDNVQ